MGPVLAVAAAAFSVYEVVTAGFTILGALKAAVSVIGAIQALSADSGQQRQSGGGGFTSEARNRTHIIRSSVQAHRIIYGEAVVSGTLVFAASSGENNKYIHLVIAIAGHECESITQCWLNAVDSNDSRFSGLVRIKYHLGGADQSADTDLIAEVAQWTTDHKLRGITYAYLRLEWNNDAWPTGIPNPTFRVKGRKCYDPRNGLTAWTDNWALCVRDYISSAHGLGSPASEIDDDTVTAAANISDETVALIDATTRKRYTMNGSFTLDGKPLDILEPMATASAGALHYWLGKWRVHAGAATSATTGLDEDDLRGPLKFRARPGRAELFNSVRGTYTDPDHHQPTDFPPVKSNSFISQDGEEIFRDLELPYTVHPEDAQRIASILLAQARQGITVEFPAKAIGLRHALWDVVPLTIASLGWSNKQFRIVNWTLADDGGVDLVLREYAASNYTWAATDATEHDPAPDTSLPNPWSVAAPGNPLITESLYSTRDGAGVKARVNASWAASADAYISSYQLQHRLQGEADWNTTNAGDETSAVINDLAPGKYEFRVRAINSLGVSAYSGTATAELVGLLAPPTAPQGLTISTIGGLAVLRWDASPDLDVRMGGYIEFCHSSATSGATWGTSTTIGDRVPGSETVAVLPLMSGTYLAKAVDSSGIYSVAAASVVTDGATVLQFAALTSLSEHATFTGTNSGTARDGSYSPPALKLDGATLMDAWGSVDSIAAWDAEGGITAAGTYTFAGGFDFGSVTRARVTKTLTGIVINDNDLVDLRSNNVDDWDDFDGTTGNEADCTIWARSTPDNPSASPTWSAWQRLDSAEYNTRGMQFQARLASYQPGHNIYITALGATAETLV
jgi:hypothetical protein